MLHFSIETVPLRIRQSPKKMSSAWGSESFLTASQRSKTFCFVKILGTVRSYSWDLGMSPQICPEPAFYFLTPVSVLKQTGSTRNGSVEALAFLLLTVGVKGVDGRCDLLLWSGCHRNCLLTSTNTFKIILHRHAHRSAWFRKFLTDSLPTLF